MGILQGPGRALLLFLSLDRAWFKLGPAAGYAVWSVAGNAVVTCPSPAFLNAFCPLPVLPGFFTPCPGWLGAGGIPVDSCWAVGDSQAEVQPAVFCF